jgi:hypothetical protein
MMQRRRGKRRDTASHGTPRARRQCRRSTGGMLGLRGPAGVAEAEIRRRIHATCLRPLHATAPTSRGLGDRWLDAAQGGSRKEPRQSRWRELQAGSALVPLATVADARAARARVLAWPS